MCCGLSAVEANAIANMTTKEFVTQIDLKFMLGHNVSQSIQPPNKLSRMVGAHASE